MKYLTFKTPGRKPKTGNRIPATARPFLISRPIAEPSYSNRSKKLTWDGPRGPRQRSLSRARRGRGRRIFRSVKYSTRGMLDYNRRFGLKISNSDPYIWRSPVLGLGSCNSVHWTQDTGHGTHHHHPHHGHHHHHGHGHHDGFSSWFFMSYWRMAGMDPYAVCLARHRAGKMMGYAKPHVIKASSKGKPYSYALKIPGPINVIQNRHPETQDRKQVTQDSRLGTEHPKPKTQNQKQVTGQLKSKISKFGSRAVDHPKPKTAFTRPAHFWLSQKRIYPESPRDPFPAGTRLKKTKPALHPADPKRAIEESKPISAKPKTHGPEHKNKNRTLDARADPGSIVRGKPVNKNTRQLGAKTIRKPDQSKPKPIAIPPDAQNPKPETQHSQQETCIRQPAVHTPKPETVHRQPEISAGYIPSTPTLKIIYPKVTVGAAALPE